jgi:hypothetical protein
MTTDPKTDEAVQTFIRAMKSAKPIKRSWREYLTPDEETQRVFLFLIAGFLFIWFLADSGRQTYELARVTAEFERLQNRCEKAVDELRERNLREVIDTLEPCQP